MTMDTIIGGGGLYIHGDLITLVMTYDPQDGGLTVNEWMCDDGTNLVKGHEYFGAPKIAWESKGGSASVKLGAGSARVKSDYIIEDPDPNNPISVANPELGHYELSCASPPTTTKVVFRIWPATADQSTAAKVILMPRPKEAPPFYIPPKVQPPLAESPPRRTGRT